MQQCIKNLGAAVLGQAAKDYCFGPKHNKEGVIKDLNSEWMDLLTDGMAKNVAHELRTREGSIRRRLRKVEEIYERMN